MTYIADSLRGNIVAPADGRIKKSTNTNPG
jgi:hypothetical protein